MDLGLRYPQLASLAAQDDLRPRLAPRLPLGPYSRPVPRALWWPCMKEGGRFLISEVLLYAFESVTV